MSSFYKFTFQLDDAEWFSAEHYYQAMKFEDEAISEKIRQAPQPRDTEKLAKQHIKQICKDWVSIKATVMKRGTFIHVGIHTQERTTEHPKRINSRCLPAILTVE